MNVSLAVPPQTRPVDKQFLQDGYASSHLILRFLFYNQTNSKNPYINGRRKGAIWTLLRGSSRIDDPQVTHLQVEQPRLDLFHGVLFLFAGAPSEGAFEDRAVSIELEDYHLYYAIARANI